ncbi:hypothetical protein AAH152_24040, partial [Vibrio parahaemolyticus]|uniref:hypothetical protein n=1 Tax=Vibrio parahaemolyticus TaxID=670 RepID=UPI003261AADA
LTDQAIKRQQQKLVQLLAFRQLTHDLLPFDYLKFIFIAYNALLRCEQRNTEATANHLNH